MRLYRVPVLLTMSLTVTGVGAGQAPAAAALSGCYQFNWQGSVPGFSLPKQLVLKASPQRELAGFFEVRPKQIRDGSFVAWRPLTSDSVEIELTASSTPATTRFSLVGISVGTAFAGELIEKTTGVDSAQTRVVARFNAVRGGRCS